MGIALRGEEPKLLIPHGEEPDEVAKHGCIVKDGMLYQPHDPLMMLRAHEDGREEMAALLGRMAVTAIPIELLKAAAGERDEDKEAP